MASGLISLVVGVGGQLLSSLFKPKQKDTYTFGPRVSDLNVPTVSPGNEINRVWGTMKVQTQYIWTSRLIETMHIAAQRAPGGKGGGGKGGGGKTDYQISFTYSVHIAIGICQGPVAQVNRLWAGGKLLWTNPNQVMYIQQQFDAAFIAEASRLLDLGVEADYAYVSAYFFAYNEFMAASTLSMWSVNGACQYIMSHTPIPTDPEDTLFPDGYPPANFWIVYTLVVRMFDPVQWDKKYVPTPIRFDSVRIYNGDEFQEPDPTMQAGISASVVPGYRGLCYAVINNLQLADFGNTVPQFTAEVMKDGILTYETGVIPPAPNFNLGLMMMAFGPPPPWILMSQLLAGIGQQATQYVAAATAKEVPIYQIIQDILLESGIPAEDFDLTTAIPGGLVVQGYAVTQPTSTRQILQDLQKIFAFDGCEAGYKIKFKMFDERPRSIIRREDLGAHIDSDDLPSSVEQTRASELDMPRRLNFKYQEPERNYSMNTVYAIRQTGGSLTVEDMDITIGISRSVAKKLVEQALVTQFKMRNTYKVFLPRKYIVLEPGDVVLVPDKEYENQWSAWRVIQMDIGANGVCEVTFCDSDFLVNAMDAIVGTDIEVDTPSLPTPSRTYAYMLDIPIPNDIIPDGPQFYCVLTGATAGWKSGGLLVDLSDPGSAPAFGSLSSVPTQGSSWYQIAQSQIQVPHGFALKTLDNDVVPGVWDNKSEVIVYLLNSQVTLSNADPVDMLTQVLNVCYIGGEICAFANAYDLGNGKWRLTKFQRGLRGTDYAMHSHGQNGTEVFVMVGAAMSRIVETQAALNKEATYVALSSGQAIGQEPTFKFTNTGNALRPYAPAITKAHRDESNNFRLEWQPRNRLNGGWLNGTDVILDQAVEAYSIDVITEDSPGVWTVKKTYDLGAVRAWDYSAATQTTDVGFAGAGITLAIYQIGNIIGRGFQTYVNI